MKKEEKMVQALRDMCRGSGMMDRMHRDQDYPGLFGVADWDDLHDLIMDAVDDLLEGREKLALLAALGVSRVGGRTLTERRQALARKPNVRVTLRTVIRYERSGARDLAELILKKQKKSRQINSVSSSKELEELKVRVTELERQVRLLGGSI